jgi:hypothetical protein
VSLGGTVARGVVVGGALRYALGFPTSVSGVNAGPGNVALLALALQGMVDWFPNPEGGWHVGAALGFGNERLEISGFDDSRVDLAASAFGGHDWRLSGKWSLGLMLDGTLYSAVDLHDQYGSDTSLRAGAAMVTFAFTGVLH